MKIVLLDAGTLGEVPNFSLLDDLGEVQSHFHTQPEQVAERIGDAPVVITNKVVIGEAVMEQCPSLKLICIAATGTNNVDLKAAERLGIAVRNVRDYSTHSVAQTTFAMLLHLLHSLDYYDRYVRSGAYSAQPLFTHHGPPFWQLAGKRFGILGLGAIGRQVAQIAEGFGCEVVYHSTSGGNLDQPWQHLSLEELLRTVDVLSIHAPLNLQTQGLIGYGQLAMMQPQAILLHTSRGGIVVEADLVKALQDNCLKAAAVDVFTQEPLPAKHPYLQFEQPGRLLLAPHIAWAGIESRTTLVEKVAGNIREVVGRGSRE